eukprot:SAG31_NODE_38225_length_298_cov_0.567839_1_plen_31_part_10
MVAITIQHPLLPLPIVVRAKAPNTASLARNG